MQSHQSHISDPLIPTNKDRSSPPLALVQTNNKTQQLYTSVTIAECLRAVCSVCGSALSLSLSSLACTTPVVRLPSRLCLCPPLPSATHLPARPTRCSNVWLTDPITFFIGLSLARREGTSLSPEQRGKNGYCSLSGKDDGHYSKRKQMMRRESLPNLHTLEHKQTTHTHTKSQKVTLHWRTLISVAAYGGKCTKQRPHIQSKMLLTKFLHKHCKYEATEQKGLICWSYDALKPVHTLTCPHTLCLMPITNTDCFAAAGVEWDYAGSLLVRLLSVQCVWACCVSKTDKCNSSNTIHPPPPNSSIYPFFCRELVWAWHGELRRFPRDPTHTDISNQTRRNPIQGRSMPPTHGVPQAEWKRENQSKQWWAILQTAITALAAGAQGTSCSQQTPVIPSLLNGHSVTPQADRYIHLEAILWRRDG